MNKYPDFYNSIPKTWEYLIGILGNACNDRHSPLRTANVAYVDGNIPYCRTVVLRYCHNDLSYLQFHTDYRSPKVKNLSENPNIAIHFYDKENKIQLSMNGVASVNYMNDTTQEAWHKTQFLSRQGYLHANSPNIPLCDPDLYHKNTVKSIIETEHGYYNFAVIKIMIHKIDFLYLHGNGNRRIIFTKNDVHEFNGEWFSF